MFLDTANTERIEKALQSGIFQGITTNPTLLLKERENREQKVEELFTKDIPFLFIQAVGSTFNELYEDAHRIYSLAAEGKKIGVKISLDQTGLSVISKLKQENPDYTILGTAIYSADQAILGALAQCDYLAPYVNRMSTHGIDPYDAIEKTRAFIDSRNLNTKIMGASFKNSQQVIQALTSGAHTATIPYDIYVQMIDKEIALSAIDVFNQHGYELRGS
ncbi:transaldolase [Oceanobacillus jeddahense]|uniref:Transaldolase n=1 Tax=Oceanobacillus jeddahense TaxID=1462527 RepID=A0ABY5JRD7_9BACI|nr:transaldolase family protein [Oceanobacillus jeddahense]UUI02365.1 transaldolase [Oceanobacillus jeddahense]